MSCCKDWLLRLTVTTFTPTGSAGVRLLWKVLLCSMHAQHHQLRCRRDSTIALCSTQWVAAWSWIEGNDCNVLEHTTAAIIRGLWGAAGKCARAQLCRAAAVHPPSSSFSIFHNFLLARMNRPQVIVAELI